MKPITQLYLKVFLVTGIPYGLIMLMFDLNYSLESIFIRFFFHSLLFGLIMSVTLVYFLKKRFKRNGITEINGTALKVKQYVSVQSELTKDEVVSYLKADAYFGQMKLNEEGNKINLYSKVTWWSWGEIITILINTENNKLTNYDISSRPKVSTTFVDFGKNLQNITQIEKLLKTG